MPSFDVDEDSPFVAMMNEYLRRPMFYRRDGAPYTGSRQESVLAWARDHSLMGNGRVSDDWTPYGEELSTVWLGLDHGLFAARPVIFETAVFSGPRRPSMSSWRMAVRSGRVLSRYSTEEEALAGHRRWFYFLLVPPPLRRRLLSEWGTC